MFNPKCIYIAWDKKLSFPSTNFRKEMMKTEYKQNRDKSSADDVFHYEQAIESVCSSLGVKNIFPNVMEADDVISWLSKTIEPNIIISVDNDLYQLISPVTSFYHLNKKIVINTENFYEIAGVDLNCILYYKAILGDASDNIHGFPGYGKVRSKKLASQLYENNGDIDKLNLSDEYIVLLKRNLKMMDLSIGYLQEQDEVSHYERQFNELKSHTANFDQFECLVREYNFKTILDNLEEWKAVFDLRV